MITKEEFGTVSGRPKSFRILRTREVILSDDDKEEEEEEEEE
ncbi:MAG: hypothetical protein ACREBS_06000 [Nitrososphaerales archaeon]